MSMCKHCGAIGGWHKSWCQRPQVVAQPAADENLEAWVRAKDNRAYFAERLAAAYVAGVTAEVERFAKLYKEADAEIARLDREYMGKPE